VTILAVTDHDTTAATHEVAAAAQRLGMQAVPGIEITAVQDGRDIHVLGYFFDPDHRALAGFLAEQRERRLARVGAIVERLATAGLHVDMTAVIDEARQHAGRSIGRPRIAAALIRAGYVRDSNEAFDKWLATGRPAFVPRKGPSVIDVIAMLHDAGGIASLAHPAKAGVDASIRGFRDEGLDAIEVFHSDHLEDDRQRYGQLATELGLLITGGSDFHGDPAHGREPGAVSLPAAEWQRLQAASSRG
jgi:predicted metal-dependent phosphoesterase TrpH